MREIISLYFADGSSPSSVPELPPLTSDDATRLYATRILGAPSDDAFLANPSSVAHLNALGRVYSDAVAEMDKAISTGDATAMIQVMGSFSSSRRLCAWADRVFQRVLKHHAAARDNFLVERGKASESVFLIGRARCEVVAAQKSAHARYRSALADIFAAAVANHDPATHASLFGAIKGAVDALLSESVQTYRNELEAPLIASYLKRETASNAASGANVMTLNDAIAAYVRHLVLAREVLHPSSLEPLMKAAAGALFCNTNLLGAAVQHFCTAEKLEAADGLHLLGGLLIPGREAEWMAPAAAALGSILSARCRGNMEVLLEEALGMLHVGIDSRIVVQSVLVLTKSAAGGDKTNDTPQLLARLVDRYVRMSAVKSRSKSLTQLLALLKPHLPADEVLQHLGELLMRRVASFHAPWTHHDELAALERITKVYGVASCVRMKQLVTDLHDSETMTACVKSIFASTPVLRAPYSGDDVTLSFKCFSHYDSQCLSSDRWSGLPMPQSLRAMSDAVDLVFRDKFPKRSFALLPHISTVTVSLYHSAAVGPGAAVTQMTLLPAHLSVIEVMCGFSSGTQRSELLARLTGFAPEQMDWCLDDLAASGVISFAADRTMVLWALNPSVKRVAVEDSRRKSHRGSDAHGAMTPTQRRTLIEAAIVSLTKSSTNGTVPRVELYRQCTAKLTRVHGLSMREFNSAVTRLVQLEYVKVSSENVHYLA